MQEKIAQKLTPDDTNTLRRRVEYEDGLLNTRTNIVLTLNGLMAIAASMSLPAMAQLVACLVIIVIDVMWIICAIDAQHFIHSLIGRIQNSGSPSIDEQLRKELQKDRFRIGSTRFMSVIIPTLLVSGWIFSLLITLYFRSNKIP